MNTSSIHLFRLNNQKLLNEKFKSVEETLSWMGAVQSQDYNAAVWAMAQRTKNASAEIIENAFNEGKILRTHVLRPTWHFLTPVDIRWMVELTAPRLITMSGSRNRELDLDEKVSKKTNTILRRILKNNNYLTREEIGKVLHKSGIATDNLQRLAHLMFNAELDTVICSGPRKGKQFTYALLEERATESKSLKQEEALYELAKKYFYSRGPATAEDFSWWSGLTSGYAKKALELLKPELHQEIFEGKTYWFHKSKSIKTDYKNFTFLLTNYDEYTIAYKNRDAVFNSSHVSKMDSRGNILFNNIIIVDGEVAGIWKKTVTSKTVRIEKTFFRKITKEKSKLLEKSCHAYADFLGLSLTED